MSAQAAQGRFPTDVEWWAIRICPECRGRVDEVTVSHKGDCPNRDRIFVPLEIPVVSYGDYLCRKQEIGALLEPLRKLVEGRAWKTCRDRSDQFWDNEGQWTVWLTAAEHEHYRDLLDSLTPDEGGPR